MCLQIISLVVGEHLIEDGISELPMNESILFIIVAVAIAFVVAMRLKSRGGRITLSGDVGKTKWYYTGGGQFAVFIAGLLVIVILYVVLRTTPGI